MAARSWALGALLLGGCLVPDEATDPSPRSASGDATLAPDALAPDAGDPPAPDATPPADLGPDAAPPPPDAAPDAAPPPAFEPTVGRSCPGDEGCATARGALRVGASAQVISDIGFERPLHAYLEPRADCNELQQRPDPRCGALDRDFLKNCGADRLCEGDEGYPGPDPDGSEGDRDADDEPLYDYFRDCGLDDICPHEDGNCGTDGRCPGDAGYVGPDADGSETYPGPDEGEGDQKFQGLWLAGFQLNRPAVGVRDHTWARTVAIEQGETLVTLTSIDAVGLFYDDIVRIRTQARTLLAERLPGVDVDLIVVQATHSHEVPDTMGLWAGEVNPDIPIPLESAVSPRYMARLQAQAALSIVEAIESLQPASMRIARTFTGAEGLVKDSREPIVINDEMGVVRFADALGGTIATLVNWGNHPEALDDTNNLISADFPGALRTAIEEGVPDSAGTVAREGIGGVAIFVQGTVGGLMTPLNVPVLDRMGAPLPNPSFLRSDVIGWRLADIALTALESGDAEDVEAPNLAFAATAYKIPVHNRVYHLGFIAGLFDRELYDWNDRGVINDRNLPHVLSETAIVTLGPLTLYTVPGELFPELAIGGYDGAKSFGRPVVDPDDPLAPNLAAAPEPPYLNDLMPGRYPWVVGLGMDELGYLVPPYDFVVHPLTPYLREAEGDHYEETNSVGPAIVPRVQSILERLAEHLGGGR